MKINPFNYVNCIKKSNSNSSRSSLKINSMDKDSVSFGGKVIYLAKKPEMLSEVILNQTRGDLLGWWFRIIGSKVDNISFVDVINKEKHLCQGTSEIIGSTVTGNVESNSINALFIERSKIMGIISNFETGKKATSITNGSTLFKDLISYSIYPELLIENKSCIKGNLICGNFLTPCKNIDINIKNKSRVEGRVFITSEAGKILVDQKSFVKDITFDYIPGKSKPDCDTVILKGNSKVLGDINFLNDRGKVIIEKGSSVKGMILNADITYIDKKGNIIKQTNAIAY